MHPVTGALWNIENGPNGGDEINIVHAGRNYGWPTVSMGRSYDGPWQGKFAQEGMGAPLYDVDCRLGLLVYSGDRFPSWKGNAFLGAMRVGEIPNTGHMQRVVFNEKGEEIRRESLHGAAPAHPRCAARPRRPHLPADRRENPGHVLKLEPAS